MNSNIDKIKSIENLLNIEKKKSNNQDSLRLIIGSFSSNLNRDEMNYLRNKYIKNEVINEKQILEEQNYVVNNFNQSNKKRRLN
tara:strand:- start:539 stop:790 length:252 start_codon:yes stop_codon:yes gene_type:complete